MLIGRSAMSVVKNIPYAVDSDTPNAHSFNLHLPSNLTSVAPPLIVFVHGGAWRSEDKSDPAHIATATALAARTAYPVVVPNYRLSPKVPTDGPIFLHPNHTADILEFLKFILEWNGPEGKRPYDPKRIVLIGHSCSAHMLSSIFLDSTAVTPELTPTPELASAVKAIICSEGIYDLDALVEDFPSYKSYFVEAAFGAGPKWEGFSVARYPVRKGAEHVKWLIVHSTGDTLINQRQGDVILEHLNGVYGEDAVSHNLKELDEEHDPLLCGKVYQRIVGDYILKLFP